MGGVEMDLGSNISLVMSLFDIVYIW